MAALFIELSTFAFISRICTIVFQIFSNNLIPDHNANVFNPPLQKTNNTLLDSLMQFCFGGFRRWDAVYFTHIAEYGYTYENCVAFFPLYPLLVSLVSRVVFLLGVLSLPQCVLLTGTALNCILFSLTAKNLYTLSIEMGIDVVTSSLSVFVFCINPASIFMTAPYSETLYLYLLTRSLLYIKRELIFHASFMIAFSILTRSNGLVGIGFILYYIVQKLVNEIDKDVKKRSRFVISKKLIFLIFRDFTKCVVCLAICLSTFILYQYYIYTKFCSSSPNSTSLLSEDVIVYGRDQGYKIVGDTPSSWCFQKIPMSYSYIQAKHWGVGFLKYYQLKQIPNFLLASPVILLSVCACWFFFKMNKKGFLTLGLLKPSVEVRKKNDNLDIQQDNGRADDHDKRSDLAINMVVHVFHLTSLIIFGCCFIHIQVLTRLFFSSSPLLYWYAGSVLAENLQVSSYVKDLVSFTSPLDASQKIFGNIASRKNLCRNEIESFDSSSDEQGFLQRFVKCNILSNIGVKILIFVLKDWANINRSTKAIFIYCIAYFLIGTFMFSNFLPWT